MSSQASLQGSLEDLETAHEELLSFNEELQASTEELQSSYEELETSNEELQASNEELSEREPAAAQQAAELERLRNEALDSLANFTRVTDALQEVVWQRDETMTEAAVRQQRACATSPGVTAEEPGRDAAALDAFIVPEDREAVSAAGVTRRPLGGRLPDRGPSGSRRWVTERGSLVVDARAGARYVGTLTDISREHRQSEQLVLQATMDAPTGLLNRYEFRRMLDTQLARSRRPVAAWPWRGSTSTSSRRSTTTTAMPRATRCWRRPPSAAGSVRESDTVGRLGGDEFAIILSTTRPVRAGGDRRPNAAASAGPVPVGARMSRPGEHRDRAVPDRRRHDDALLQAADAAMYAVKGRGGDDVEYFDEGMRVAAESRRQMRADIAAAITGKEFDLHYQPIVSTADGSLWGVEALLRWTRPGGRRRRRSSSASASRAARSAP